MSCLSSVRSVGSATKFRGAVLPNESLSISHLDLVGLTPLMELSAGRPEIMVALIDGPIAAGHPDLLSTRIRTIAGKPGVRCAEVNNVACLHGTFIAGILSARRGAAAPAICPDCTLLVRPIFAETPATEEQMPSARPDELADAIIECVNAGAHVINLSAALRSPSLKGESRLVNALDYAARRSVMVVVAAGNQGQVGGSVMARHPWVIPVVACTLQGQTLSYSNLGDSIGRRGLRAPGEGVTSLGAGEQQLSLSGTSVAAPFVTGAIALLLSEFPGRTAAEVKTAATRSRKSRRATLVPPLLDAWAAFQILATPFESRRGPGSR